MVNETNKKIGEKKIMKKAIIVCLLVFMLMALVPVSVSAGNKYYVAMNGNDSNPGTIKQPFKTIQRAVNVSYAGDTIYIRGGIYNEQVKGLNSGMLGQWITIRNYNNENPIIDGTGKFTNGGIFHFTNQHHVLFYGLTVRNSASYGFFFPASGGPNTNNLTVSHCEIFNCSESAIYIYPYNTGWLAYDFIAEYNTIHDCQNGWYDTPANEVITVSNVQRGIVRYNYMYDNHRISIDIKNDACQIEVYGNRINNTPTRPVIHGNSSWINSGIYVDGYDDQAWDVFVYKNIVWGNLTGYIMGTEQGGTLTNVDFFDNIYNGTGHAFQINNHWRYGGPWVPGVNHLKKDCSITHNTVTGKASMCFQLTDKTESFENFTVRNNIFFGFIGINIGSGECDLTQSNVDHNLFACGWSAYYGDYYIEDDPLFVSATNFHLKSVSPCIDAGLNYGVASFDFDGKKRPIGDSVDIGAYEYGSSIPGFEMLALFGALFVLLLIKRRKTIK
jgi:hypothetical protein